MTPTHPTTQPVPDPPPNWAECPAGCVELGEPFAIADYIWHVVCPQCHLRWCWVLNAEPQLLLDTRCVSP